MSKIKTLSYVAPSQQGKTLIGAHFALDVKRQLKTIAAQEDTPIQALLEGAISNLTSDRQKIQPPHRSS